MLPDLVWRTYSEYWNKGGYLGTKYCSLLMQDIFSVISKHQRMDETMPVSHRLNPTLFTSLVSVQTPMWSTRAFWKKRPMNHWIFKWLLWPQFLTKFSQTRYHFKAANLLFPTMYTMWGSMMIYLWIAQFVIHPNQANYNFRILWCHDVTLQNDAAGPSVVCTDTSGLWLPV